MVTCRVFKTRFFLRININRILLEITGEVRLILFSVSVLAVTENKAVLVLKT